MSSFCLSNCRIRNAAIESVIHTAILLHRTIMPFVKFIYLILTMEIEWKLLEIYKYYIILNT